LPVQTRSGLQVGTDLATTLFGGFRATTTNVITNNNVTNYDSYTVIPEPSSIGVLAGGVGLFLVLRRRRRVS